MPDLNILVYEAVEEALRYSTELRIAATLHRRGVTAQQWMQACATRPWSELPEPMTNAITNLLFSMEKNVSIIGSRGGTVKVAQIPGIPEVGDHLR